MKSDKYILDGKQAVKCPDLMEWAIWIEENSFNRRVADEHIGDVRVSKIGRASCRERV